MREIINGFDYTKERCGLYMGGEMCPMNANPAKGAWCPSWWETAQTNVATGEVKIIEGCEHHQMQLWMIEIIKASNRPAAAMESMRNEIGSRLERVAPAVFAGMVKSMAERDQTPQIEHQRTDEESRS